MNDSEPLYQGHRDSPIESEGIGPLEVLIEGPKTIGEALGKKTLVQATKHVLKEWAIGQAVGKGVEGAEHLIDHAIRPGEDKPVSATPPHNDGPVDGGLPAGGVAVEPAVQAAADPGMVVDPAFNAHHAAGYDPSQPGYVDSSGPNMTGPDGNAHHAAGYDPSRPGYADWSGPNMTGPDGNAHHAAGYDPSQPGYADWSGPNMTGPDGNAHHVAGYDPSQPGHADPSDPNTHIVGGSATDHSTVQDHSETASFDPGQ